MSASVNGEVLGLSAELTSSVPTGGADHRDTEPTAPEMGVRVLVVAEDSRDIQGLRELLGQIASGPYGVEGYSGVGEVLERCLRGTKPDCILVDAGSIELGDVVNGLRRGGLDIPVVGLVGKADSGGAGALARGAVDWIEWAALTPETLRRAVRFASERQLVVELRERAERAERMAAVGQLAAGIAQEITQPTSFVLTNLSELRSRIDDMARFIEDAHGPSAGDLSEEALIDQAMGRSAYASSVVELNEMLKDCMDGLRRIASLSSELRNFAQPGLSVREPVDLGELSRSVVKMLSPDLRGRARIEFNLAEQTVVSAERGALVQAVSELVEGCLSHFQAGHREAQWLRVSTFSCNREIGLMIEDNAYSGLRTTAGSGSWSPAAGGPSRSLARQCAERFGGRLVRTQREGTNLVSLILPSYEGPPLSSSPPPSSQTDVERRVRGRALIIDDEQAVLRAYERVLRREFEVTTARDGEEALHLALQDPRFEFILCDLTMPNLDGVRFFEELSQRLPQLASRVVFCSGGVFSPRQESFLRRVPNQVLDKPVPPTMLLRIAADLCERHAGTGRETQH